MCFSLNLPIKYATDSAGSRFTFSPAPFATLSDAFAILVGDPFKPRSESSTSFKSALPQTVTSLSMHRRFRLVSCNAAHLIQKEQLPDKAFLLLTHDICLRTDVLQQQSHPLL